MYNVRAYIIIYRGLYPLCPAGISPSFEVEKDSFCRTQKTPAGLLADAREAFQRGIQPQEPTTPIRSTLINISYTGYIIMPIIRSS